MQKMGMTGITILILAALWACIRINPFLLRSQSALSGLTLNNGLVELFRARGYEPISPLSPVTSMFRAGSDRSGTTTAHDFHLPVKVTWRLENLFGSIHTASKSTPAVDDSGIYFGTDLGIFYKVDHSGKIKWRFRSDSDQQGIHGTALLDQHHVYFGNYGGWFYCLNKEDGRMVWMTSVANAIGSSPLVVGNKLVFAAEFNDPRNGYLVALDIQTGKKIWSSPYFEEQVHSSPTLATSAGVLGVGSNNGIYWGIDLESGQVKWKYQAEQPIKGTAIHSDGLFCFTSWSGRLHCVHDESGEEAFVVPLEGSSQSSPALDSEKGWLFVSSSSGYLFKIDLKRMTVLSKALLRGKNQKNRYGMSSPILMRTKKENLVVSPCDDTSICFFNDRSLALVEKVEVGGVVTGSFAVWKKSIFANVDGRGLIRLD